MSKGLAMSTNSHMGSRTAYVDRCWGGGHSSLILISINPDFRLLIGCLVRLVPGKQERLEFV